MRFVCLIFALALAFCGGPAVALDIPSSVSGHYSLPTRSCNILYSRFEGLWTQIDVRCLRYDGETSSLLATVWTAGGCPSNMIALPFDPRLLVSADKAGARVLPGVFVARDGAWQPMAVASGAELFAVRDFGPGVLHAVVGTDPTLLANGIGIPETWVMRDPLPVPWPYTCTPSTTPAISLRQRLLVCRENPNALVCRG